MTRTVPAVALPARGLLPEPNTPPAYARRASFDVPARDPTRWRADHELSRDERRRARRVAEEVNLFDLGWARNWVQVMDHAGQGESAREGGVEQDAEADGEADEESLLGGRGGRVQKSRRRRWTRYALWLWPATRPR